MCWIKGKGKKYMWVGRVILSSWTLCTTGWTTASGTGPVSGIHPWYQVQCGLIVAMGLSLWKVLEWWADYASQSEAKGSKWKLCQWFLNVLVPSFPLPHILGLTVLPSSIVKRYSHRLPKGPQNTGYAWAHPSYVLVLWPHGSLSNWW